MTYETEQILHLFKSITGNGSFVHAGDETILLLGLQVEGVGEVGLPVSPTKAKELIKVAAQAPFGKGSKTITDTKVRKTWEIDATQVMFKNPEWEKCVKRITSSVQEGLGVDGTVKASLYKLLIYEKGGFFLPHKDSEKEAGMFATLSIGLPSAHTGGKLSVRFDGREEAADFSKSAAQYKMPYVAFFADCEHEIAPVKSGYRICVVYNLIKKKGKVKPQTSEISPLVNKMVPLLESCLSGFGNRPKAFLLGHQYTPANYSLQSLKHHDKPRAMALIKAAEKAGFYAKLGLVTCYRQGDLIDNSRYYSKHGYTYDVSPDATMGDDIYDESTSVKYWEEEGMPGLGKRTIDEDDIFSDMELAEGEPTEKEGEGFTGNAGMTMEYWYHYGAVILWPKTIHLDLIMAASTGDMLNWLKFYHKNWNRKSIPAKEHAIELIKKLTNKNLKEDRYSQDDFSVGTDDFSPVANVLLKLKDEKFLKEICGLLLFEIFTKINAQRWCQLIETFDPPFFKTLFKNLGKRKKLDQTQHLLSILEKLVAKKSPRSRSFAMEQIALLPHYIKQVKIAKIEDPNAGEYYSFKTEDNIKTTKTIVGSVLKLSQHNKADEDWTMTLCKAMTTAPKRFYINEILLPFLVAKKHKTDELATALRTVSIKYLKRRTKTEPAPLPDWTRAVKNDDEYYDDVWEMLKDFLASPIHNTFNFRRNASERKQVERAIRKAEVDLRTETIHEGSPHTLRIIKTNKMYQRQLKEYKEDLRYLEKLEKAEK